MSRSANMTIADPAVLVHPAPPRRNLAGNGTHPKEATRHPAKPRETDSPAWATRDECSATC
ncbi:MAG TPA: hypothetical protein VMB73_03700, partial [Acetobacteraceae bacterium]|nr:hypothetical protein [Acetobacteraceae bacterium]